MASQFEQGDRQPRLAVLAFTCPGCDQRFTRLIRGDPDLVMHCFACDYDRVRRTSERLLTLVFGVTPQ